MLPPHIPTASGCVGWECTPRPLAGPIGFGEKKPWGRGAMGCGTLAAMRELRSCSATQGCTVLSIQPCCATHNILGTHRGPSPWAVGAGTQVTHLGGATTGRGFAVSRWLLRHFNLELFCVDISQRKISDFLSHNGIFLLQPIYQNGNKSPAWKSKHFLLVE